MRSLRAVKYRKKYRKLLVLAQMLAIWYVMILSAALLTSDTFAYFSDASSTKMSISSGTWWDGSELEFVGKKDTENIKACAPYEVSIEVKNKGFDMIDSTEYEVYYSENGNPENQGEKVGEGKIEAIKQGETTKLTYGAEENGSYMFKVYQVPGYKDNYDERTEIWSKKFMVKCLEEEEVLKEQEEIEEETEEVESEQEEESEPSPANEEETVKTGEEEKEAKKEKEEKEEKAEKDKQDKLENKEEKEKKESESTTEQPKANEPEKEKQVEVQSKAKTEEEPKASEATEEEEGEQ